MKTLKDVKPGQSAVVDKVLVTGTAKGRLMAMGVLKGATIGVVKVAPLGDPIEVQIKGYNLSFRKSEAEQIMVL
ncbi:ferrous iron uptake protein feoa [Heliomicrobium modesticaldum Ice1]|uniref:Ferrous iron uptake protein feoa n=1 Tax=Heliobacterium modesticaldum (strain ATCC 51547 / Ice1) TaxID=498761 RepID=B0TDP8_HELMI|nr:FeoA family protein [Heliomicrobium modesticaldum]ABZ85573.1 ferrous iron uptake protein feoa [Heliomicrobium modesticaldum Ice1]